MERRCSRCGKVKTLQEFVKRLNRPYGKGYHCLVCDKLRLRKRRENPEVRAKQKDYYRKNETHIRSQMAKRREQLVSYVNTYKDVLCVDCGDKYPLECMDFDHLRDKVRDIGNMKTYSRKDLREEIAKCEVVCANCHRIRTHKRREDTTTTRKKIFNERIKAYKQRPCIDCTQSFPTEVMDFDHIPSKGVKEKCVGLMWNLSWECVLEEVSKCEVVCANCHRIRTRVRRERRV